RIPAILTVFLILALCWEIGESIRKGAIHAGRNVAYGAFCGVYISLFGGLGAVREVYAHTLAGMSPRFELGALLLFLMLVCVWATDSFAYFVGRAWGKRKLAPTISPNKTVEGSVGGLVAALIVGAAFGQ